MYISINTTNFVDKLFKKIPNSQLSPDLGWSQLWGTYILYQLLTLEISTKGSILPGTVAYKHDQFINKA